MGTPEENKELIRRYFLKIDEGGLSAIDEFVSPDFVDHTTTPGFPLNRSGLKQAAGKFIVGSPDAYHKVDDLIAVGDTVIGRIRGYGTHTGEMMGIPPTGRMFTAMGLAIWRISDGKIVERWNVVDFWGILRQLAEED